MSAATGSSQAGRPVGPSPETLDRQRRVHAMRGNGLSPSMIAECERISEAYVRMLLKESPGQDDRPPDGAPLRRFAESPVEALPRPLSRRTLLDRAWEATHYFPMKILRNAERYAWMEAVMIIHDCGDGTEVRYGPRSQVRDMAHFCQGIDLPVDDMRRWLDDGLLVELPGGVGLALPYTHRLRPREARRRAPPGLFAPSSLGQREMLHVLPGGLSGATETPWPTQGKPPSDATETPWPAQGKPPSNATEIPWPTQGKSPSDASEIPGNGATEILSKQTLAAKSTTTTTTKSLESLESGGGGGTFLSVPPAQEGATEIPPPAQPKPPLGASDIKSERSLRLAREVGDLCGYGEPKPADVEIVRNWLSFPGISDDLILAAVREDRAKPEPKPVWNFGLFTNEVKAALSVAKAQADKAREAANPAAPPAPPTAEDLLRQALKDRWDRWFNGNPASGISGRSGPMPPRDVAAFKHLGGPLEPAAHRWLAILEAWWAAGRPSDGRPPEFDEYMRDPVAMEADMLACEEVLSRPDDADG